ncbi:MAG TPA: sensor histidine kinase [Pseudonocardiaceae bacterium]|jgi:signal transduction histidine kinase|nr:sensor histidine kinase [Pseudonocardiaceae bacterium]
MAFTSDNTRTGWRRTLVALGRCLTLLALLPLHLAVLTMEAAVGVLLLCGQLYLFPAVVVNIRWLPTLHRRLASAWSGTAMSAMSAMSMPYLPEPPPPQRGPDGFYRTERRRKLYDNDRLPRWQSRCRWVWTDPATWRDLCWLVLEPVIGTAIAALPVALIGYGLVSTVRSPIPGLGLFAVPIGLVLTLAGWLAATPSVALHGRWSALLLARRHGPAPAADRRWIGDLIVDLLNSLRLIGLSLGAGVLFVGEVVALACTGPLLGMPLVRHGRALPMSMRCLLGEWQGVRVKAPYRPEPVLERAEGGYPPLWAGFRARWMWLVTDPATWRDLLWLGAQPLVGVALALLPLLMFAYGWWGLALPGVEGMTGLSAGPIPWYGLVAGSHLLAFALGIVGMVLGAVLLPVFLGWHSRWATLLLAPTGRARLLIERDQLSERVATLTESRSVVMDTQANEVRRIERDLHDGAQARLVAMGMTLGAVEALMDHDPAAAKRLLAQAREASRTALRELRDLVRGIHPPVLAERGLADAIRALALDNPMTVVVQANLPGRADAPVESAVYFAVAEALANATKHAHAERVWIDARHEDGVLRISVLDDGCGGADAARGSGLRGIERRLGTFDGTFTLSSPLGGPTMVAMEVPCVLSWPRTSTSSGTD